MNERVKAILLVVNVQIGKVRAKLMRAIKQKKSENLYRVHCVRHLSRRAIRHPTTCHLIAFYRNMRPILLEIQTFFILS